MKLYPDIAQNYFSTRPTYKAVLSDPNYFLDGTVELFEDTQE